MRLQWGGILMTVLSAESIQGVLEGFSAARSAMALIPRNIPALHTGVRPVRPADRGHRMATPTRLRRRAAPRTLP